MKLERTLHLVVRSVTGIVNDQEVMRTVVLVNKIHHGAIELQLGFGRIVQFDNLGVVVETLAE